MDNFFHSFYFKMKIDIFDFENNKSTRLTIPKTDCEYVIRNNTYIVFTKKIEVVQLLLKHLKNFNIKLITNSKEYVIKFKRNKNILVV